MHIIHYDDNNLEFVVEIDDSVDIYYQKVENNRVKIFGNYVRHFFPEGGIRKHKKLAVDFDFSQTDLMIYFDSDNSNINTINQNNLLGLIKELKNSDSYKMKLIFDDNTIKSLLVRNSQIRYLVFMSLISKFVSNS